MQNDQHDYCYYSGLPSSMAYMEEPKMEKKKSLSLIDIDQIIEMALEDRTSIEAIEFQFSLKESDEKGLMKKNLKYSSYKLWRTCVEICKTKHRKSRQEGVIRFKNSLKKQISHNKLSKRK